MGGKSCRSYAGVPLFSSTDQVIGSLAVLGWEANRFDKNHMLLLEVLVNAVHKAAPGAAIAFNTRPEDTADAAARWLKVD